MSQRMNSRLEALEARTLFATRFVDFDAPGPIHDGTNFTRAFRQ
jgi:hypothetical protein